MATRKRTSKKQSLATPTAETNPKAPLDPSALLSALEGARKVLEADLLERARKSPAVTAAMEARHAEEKKRERTADDFSSYQRRLVEQVAAAWMLSVVFVRTLEDRGLVAQNRIAGPGAMDAQRSFLELAPSLTERDYLRTVFREMTRIPAAEALFDARHNPVWTLAPSAEATKALLEVFRAPSAEAPALRFGQEDTRFLGDLYQDLNENVRKRYALLQTPRFVESFILDRTLEPAIELFGLDEATLIDPTCGSGHFLLGAFERLLDHRLRREPGLPKREAAQKALDAVYGADINPYAVAIAKFRLTLAFLEKAGYDRIDQAPRLPLHLAVADSLLYNPQHAQGALFHQDGVAAGDWEKRAFAMEDEEEARDVLHREFAAVVGNPPYIVVQDAVLRQRYRQLYVSAAGKYSLGAPFTERFFQLARRGGRVGMITANSFMKREFGKKLIEQYLPTVDLDLIVNTSGAYIPGHGTPTVLLFGARRDPERPTVHAVLAKRGEPTTPEVPERGQVWSSIAEHWRETGFENDYVSVADVERAQLASHPWSLGGGGAAELKALLEERAEGTLGELTISIGFMAITGEDDAYVAPPDVFRRNQLVSRAFGLGEAVRDWGIEESTHVLFPYDDRWTPSAGKRIVRWLWAYRSLLSQRLMFGKTQIEAGHEWFEYRHVGKEKVNTPLSIAFAFVATHNHFVLDRGGKVFNRSAPIIKLPETATEEDHLALLAYLNSSTACFWMKQVFHKKSSASQKHHADPARAAYEFAGTGLEAIPVPSLRRNAVVPLIRELCELAERRTRWLSGGRVDLACLDGADELKDVIAKGWAEYDALTARAVYLQEELDWHVYCAFGLVTPDEAELDAPGPGDAPLGSRPFELTTGYDAGVSERARRTATTGSDSAEAPDHWRRRVGLLDREGIALIESREFKRMWRDTERNVDQHEYREELPSRWLAALAADALEEVARDGLATSRDLLQRSAERLGGAAEFLGEDLHAWTRSILASEGIPYLAALRHTETGLEKRAAWEHTWDLQRREDAGERLSAPIPVPPKYARADYRDARYWSLRGKLDVPKERFISYPGCESDEDGEPVYGWAGWDHAQRAQALVSLYQDRKTREGWPKERLVPMLAGLLELLPWLLQWHNEPSADYDVPLGDAYTAFLEGELRELSLTQDDLRAWRPAKKVAKRAARAKKSKKEPA